MKHLKIFLAIALTGLISACDRVGVFEKNVSLPQHQWESSFRPNIEFEIRDTTAAYNMYVVIRHTNAYDYNNIWIKASLKEPDSGQTHTRQYDLLLANDSKGWLGEGMDDIFEQRILIQPQAKFPKAGKYQFSVQQIMRQNPLEEVMNVGLRIEKAL